MDRIGSNWIESFGSNKGFGVDRIELSFGSNKGFGVDRIGSNGGSNKGFG